MENGTLDPLDHRLVASGCGRAERCHAPRLLSAGAGDASSPDHGMLRSRLSRRIVARASLLQLGVFATLAACLVGPAASHADQDRVGVSCNRPEAAKACGHERSCGKVTQAVIDGERIQARVFALRHSCKGARQTVHSGYAKTPRSWICTGSEVYGLCYRSRHSRIQPWSTVRRRRHIRGSIVLGRPSRRASSARHKLAYVACYSSDVGYQGFFRHPQRCFFTRRGRDGTISANRADVTSLKWRHWGRKRTIGRGVLVGLGHRRKGVTITLTKLKRCHGGGWTYRHLIVRGRHQKLFNWGLSHCPAP